MLGFLLLQGLVLPPKEYARRFHQVGDCNQVAIK